MSVATSRIVAAVTVAVLAACSTSARDSERAAPPTSVAIVPAASAASRAGTTPLVPVAGAGILAPSLARVHVAGSDTGDDGAIPRGVIDRGAGDAIADVDDCSQCHSDVAAQWRKSAHAFASFGNPVYRLAVDKLRADRGEKTSQFCGGCHDVALLVDGAMLTPIQPTDLRAHAGITCRTCHSIDAPRPDGNGSWDLDLSPVPLPKDGDPDSILRHRARVGRVALRTAEMCSTCHKAFLDESTGNAHHLVGQDDASPWARSAFAGSEAARIDEEVPRKDCRGCHMPRVAATQGDAGAKNGTVASHYFLGGGTWLAAMQGDAELVENAQAFLTDRVSVDVAGLRHESGALELVGVAPVALVPGERAIVDVALRNLDVGHRFPGGVMDAQGTWLEVVIDDRQGRRVAEAGTDHERTGADPTAHVLLAYMARADGSRVEARETHEFETPVWNDTIAPRDAAVVGYAFVAPAQASRYPLVVTARLRHRSRSLELQRAACADTRSERGRAFGRAGLKKVARAIDACKLQPITEIGRAVVRLGAAAGGGAGGGADPAGAAARAPETRAAAFARSFAYGLGLTHALSERLDDARAPLLAALEDAETPRQRAMALGALAAIAAKQGRTDETFALAERADAAAREAGMPPPVAMQRARADVLASTWKVAEAASLYLDVATRSPRDDTAWIAAAIAFAGAGDPHAALDAAQRGLAIQPRDGDLLRVQALAYGAPGMEVGVGAPALAAAEAAFLERRSPDAAPAIHARCSAGIRGCANERIPVHVHDMRQR